MNPENPRKIYLLNTLDLSHDPFAGPVAEQELHSSENEPYFFSYYIDPKNPESNKPILQTLRDARNGLIFGQPGSGKTTLRYTLEADCRSVYDRTLVVTYELSHKIAQPPTAEEHWTNIAMELAIDLFIQVIEQLDTFDIPTDDQKKHLKAQIALIWPHLRRTVDLILADDFSDRENGLANLWPRLYRPAIRYINQSDEIINLIKDCSPGKKEPQDILTRGDIITSGKDLLKAGIAAAKAWGFKQIFVLVDGIDAHEREVESMLTLISPLLDNLAKWQTEDLSFYFFLTSEMKPPLIKTYREVLNNLTHSPTYYVIEWDKGTLIELLSQRLKAANSHIPGFNALAAADLEDSLENCLIKAAQNSPRQLLRVVSALIDAHAQSEHTQPLITSKDWRHMQEKWSYGPPAPPDLAANSSSL